MAAVIQCQHNGLVGDMFSKFDITNPTPPPVNQSYKFNGMAGYSLVRQGAGVSMTMISALVLWPRTARILIIA